MPEKIVATTLSIPEPSALAGAGHFSEQAAWVFWAIGAVIAGVFWFRRKASRDNTEIAKDKAETNIVSVLAAERDKAMADAREAWAQRTQDAEKIARFSLENEYLRRDVKNLSTQVDELKQQLAAVMSAITSMKPDFKAPVSTEPTLL